MAKSCDWCGRSLSKGRRRFCCNKHKDRWHNANNPRGYQGTRINSTDWEDARKLHEEAEDSMHPFDSYSLGQD